MAASLMIAVELPDHSIVSYDRARRTLILTMPNGSVLSAGGSIPARPNRPVSAQSAAGGGHGLDVADVEVPLVPISRNTKALKLGWKKFPVVGTESWKQRFLCLTEKSITYHETEGAPAKNTIILNPGVLIRVVQAQEPARKDRYEDNDTGVFSMMSQPIGAMMNLYSGPIGKPNCVECHVPVQVGNMLNTVMSNNVTGLAFGGGRDQLKKSRGRTFYFSFDSLQEANSFADAISNNVKILTKAAPLGGAPLPGDARAGNFAGVDAALNQARALQANAKLMTDPSTSLEWYKTSLNSTLPNDVLYEKLMSFYDQLAAVNILPSY